MINQPIPINFLTHVYSGSTPDVANILIAQAEDDYDTIINYLYSLRVQIRDWMDELYYEKEAKQNE